jgi:ABC-type transport system involved in cytochrome c biogenesis ATPase subunit
MAIIARRPCASSPRACGAVLVLILGCLEQIPDELLSDGIRRNLALAREQAAAAPPEPVDEPVAEPDDAP